MKTNNNYKVDFISKAIIISKRFAKNAGTLGTPEFKEMCELRAAYPDFSISYKEIKGNSSKKTYKSLSIARMIATIEVLEGAEAAKAFETKVSVFDNQRSKYPLVKKYFLSLYKDALENLSAQDELEIEKILSKDTKAA